MKSFRLSQQQAQLRNKWRKTLKGDSNHLNVNVTLRTMTFHDFFAVFDLSPLTLCINCSF